MSVLKDAELEAIQLDIFQPEAPPQRKYRQPQYFTIHQMNKVTATLNTSRGAHYLLTTDGELCFPYSYHPTKVSGAGDVFFNAEGEVAGISNDSEHYNTKFNSVFPVLWLLRNHGLRFAGQVELLEEDIQNPRTTFITQVELHTMLDKLPQELTDELLSANKGNLSPMEEVVEDYAFLDEFTPQVSTSQCDVWRKTRASEPLEEDSPFLS